MTVAEKQQRVADERRADQLAEAMLERSAEQNRLIAIWAPYFERPITLN
jgi:hypothetical protein